MKKDKRDLKKEYNLILKWRNSSRCDYTNGVEPVITTSTVYWLESFEGERIVIISDSERVYFPKAVEFIKANTVNVFRHEKIYESHVKLFDLMGIQPVELKSNSEKELPIGTVRYAVQPGRVYRDTDGTYRGDTQSYGASYYTTNAEAVNEFEKSRYDFDAEGNVYFAELQQITDTEDIPDVEIIASSFDDVVEIIRKESK